MLQHTRPPPPDQQNAIAMHESCYQVAGHVLGVAVRPPTLDAGTRFNACDILAEWPTDPDTMELAAVVLYAASDVLIVVGDPIGNGRDGIEARQIVHDAAMARRHATLHVPSVLREAQARCEQLRRQAEALVEAHWDAIEAAAVALLDAQPRSKRPARKPA